MEFPKNLPNVRYNNHKPRSASYSFSFRFCAANYMKIIRSTYLEGFIGDSASLVVANGQHRATFSSQFIKVVSTDRNPFKFPLRIELLYHISRIADGQICSFATTSSSSLPSFPGSSFSQENP